MIGLMGNPDSTYGQVFILLTMLRHHGTFGSQVAIIIGALLDRVWRGAPYHLKLDLIDTAGWCWRAEDPEREALILKLDSLPKDQHVFISTTILEALQHLGALDEGTTQHKAVVRAEIAECLAHQDDPDACSRAFGIYSACMDHPYSEAYAEVFNTLPTSERAQMFTMAARGADSNAFFVVMLITDIAGLSDAAVTGELARFLTPPDKDSFNLSDPIQTFTLAHLAFASGALPLPSTGSTASMQENLTWTAIGEVLYWMNRADFTLEVRQRASASAMTAVMANVSGNAINAMRLIEQAHVEGWTRPAGLPPFNHSAASLMPAVGIKLAKEALDKPETLTGTFKFYDIQERTADLAFALALIGRYSTTADIAYLRNFIADKSLGTSAISAIRGIEERLVAVA
ncbi:hypothetical protein PY650_26720 [Rhizobium calliandrae]|uniref:ADP-ribosylglycohydrolase n=1 Tax=Rhizobium calliandrae TaxID=1312182 RepID=A0ABT7KKM6_9HYPH|nr:hypothetical protein [Rhizobium calliandrae]MDL2409165.1 hypothetical protein [Rhizobium calliandrae]